MRSLKFLLFSLLGHAILAVGCSSDSTVPPNILVITTDDQGWADLSAFHHHASDISTPHMDRLASQGVLFSDAYVTAPVCSPSRAGWISGQYQQKWNKEASWEVGLPNHVKTIAEYLKEGGYTTGKVGKSDFGVNYHSNQVREYPLHHGFDEFLGFSSHAHDYFLLSEEVENKTPDPYGVSAALGALFENKGKRSFSTGYTTEIFTDWALGFLERNQNKPFFLQVSYNSVHHLIHEVPEKYLRKYGAEPIPNYDPETMGKYEDYYLKYGWQGEELVGKLRPYYLANLNCLDDNIGRLLDALVTLNIAKNTLIIFFSDNGGEAVTGANNRPLRGAKGMTFEGGIRVPFIMSWPDRFPLGTQMDFPVSTLDILPTCLESANLPPAKDLDGISLFGQIVGTDGPSSLERPLFWKFQNKRAVRLGDWKLVLMPDIKEKLPKADYLEGPLTQNMPQLFHLKEDVSEQINLYNDYPQIAKRLERYLEKWENDMESHHKVGTK